MSEKRKRLPKKHEAKLKCEEDRSIIDECVLADDRSTMELVKGVPVARPGRRMGCGNNISLRLKGKMTEWLEDNFQDFAQAFSKMSPRDKVDAYLTIYKYSVPETKHEDDKELNSSARTFVINTYFGGNKE